MIRRIVLVIMLFAGLVKSGAGQNNYYTITIRTQFSDSSQYCSCPQNYNQDEYSSSGVCNTLDNVMVNVYSDTSLLSTTVTDHTGYTYLNIYPGTYKLVFIKQNCETLTVIANLNATTDRRSTFSSPIINAVHFVDNGSSSYFLCTIMNRLVNKSGVRIVPK